MLTKKIWLTIITLVVLFGLALAACAPATQPPPAAQATEAPPPAAAAPTKVNIGFIYCGPMDEPWSQAMIQAVERVKADNPPQGLDITYKYFENVKVDEFEKFTRNVIDSGEYDIV